MTKDEDFKLLKIQTIVLRVHIHCDGCKQEVKKLLQKIEGVYTVAIDAENQKVTASGNVDSGTLIKRLAKSGKHAELWSQKSARQNKPSAAPPPHQLGKKKQAQGTIVKDSGGGKNPRDQLQNKGLPAFKNQHKKPLPPLSSDEDGYDEEDEDDDDADDEHDLAFLGGRLGGINLGEGNNGAPKKSAAHFPAAGVKKKGGASNPAAGHQPGLKHPSGGGGGGAKVGFSGLQQGMNPPPPAGRRMNPPPPSMGGGGLGLPFSQHPGAFPAMAAGMGGPMMMNMQQQPAAPPQHQSHGGMGMGMNIARAGGGMGGMMMPQPQMMYHRSPLAPSYTGYYPCNPPAAALYYPHQYPPESGGGGASGSAADYGAHLFSDENAHSCAVM